VCGKFAEIMSASRGEVEMVVTSATVCAFCFLLPTERERVWGSDRGIGLVSSCGDMDGCRYNAV
jgi:hypothetical protein